MTSKSTNQTIHEAMGLCWHEWSKDNCKKCIHCGFYDFPPFTNLPDYTSDWSAWGKALEWAQEQEWWPIFLNEQFDVYNTPMTAMSQITTPLKGSTALAEFITKHPDYFKKED